MTVTDLSAARVRSNSAALAKEGWVAERPTGTGGSRLALGPTAGHVLAISVAREAVRCAIYAPDRRQVASAQTRAAVFPRLPRPGEKRTHPGLTPVALKDLIVGLLLECAADATEAVRLLGCMVSWPTRIASASGEPAPIRARAEWGDQGVAGLVALALKDSGYPEVPVQLINDANAEVLAETRVGVAQRRNTVLSIKLAGGVGAGLVHRNRLLLGASGFAGEIGHVPVSLQDLQHARRSDLPEWVRPLPRTQAEMNQVRCACGLPGHLQAFVSIPAIVERVELEPLDPDHLVDAWPNLYSERARAIGQNRSLGALLEEVGRLIGRALFSPVALLDPDVVVVRPALLDSGRLRDGVASELKSQFADIRSDAPLSVRLGTGGEEGLWMAATGAAIRGFDVYGSGRIRSRIERAPLRQLPGLGQPSSN